MNTSPPTEIWCTISGTVDPVLVQKIFGFFATATQQGVQTVHLLIHSTGGFVDDGICLHNYLNNLPVNVVAYNAGNISSVAVIVFLAAKRRIASETAKFMIHKTHVTPNAGSTAVRLKEIADSLDIDNSRTESILRAYLSLPEDKWALHERGDLTITAQEALQFALIHEVANFSPPQGGPLFNI